MGRAHREADLHIHDLDMQNEWAGAQAFSSFDTYLAPYIRKDNLSYEDVHQSIQELIYNLNVPSRWGFEVGLHATGAYPERLQAILPDLAWIGLDVKAVPTDATHWHRVTGIEGSSVKWAQSLLCLLASKTSFECRSTVHPDFFDEAALLSTVRYLSEAGVTHYALQICRRAPGMIARLSTVPDDWPSKAVIAAGKASFSHFTIRRG